MEIWLKKQWGKREFRLLLFITVLLTVLLIAECWLFHYSIWKSIRYLVLLWVLSLTASIDIEMRIIPNKVVLGLLGFRTVILVIESVFYRAYFLSIFVSAFGGLLLGGGIFLLCYLITRGGVGAGDVKLFAALGYFLGSSAVFTAMFLTVLTAAGYSIAALLMKRISLKQELAFAPFIFAGTALTMLLGV